MKLMITGPQGSGKTTQARILSQRLQICLVKTGDLVRAKAKEDSEEGRKLQATLASGELSDDSIVSSLLQAEIEHEKCKDGFVVDGYPRRLSQLEAYDPDYDFVVYLNVSDEVAIERMEARGREDDTPELIKERLKWFHEDTNQVIDYYQKLGKLIRVDGEQEIEEVTEEIMRRLTIND